MFRLIGAGLALGAMAWANESSLRPVHIINSILAAIVVLFIFSAEIILVREARASLNTGTLLINCIVLFFPLMNIAVFSAPLAGIIIAVGIGTAWFLIRARSILLGEKTRDRNMQKHG
ncbi:MAG: hypothetical protein JRG73_16525 [Deltaproteobacteria bacterium]|nr:hypothetical protein [Deltaproteobacteria bacterium]